MIARAIAMPAIPSETHAYVTCVIRDVPRGRFCFSYRTYRQDAESTDVPMTRHDKQLVWNAVWEGKEESGRADGEEAEAEAEEAEVAALDEECQGAMHEKSIDDDESGRAEIRGLMAKIFYGRGTVL